MDGKPISLMYRRYALGLLLAVNLLNYIDRQVLFAVFPLIKIDLNLSDTALGFLGSAFMFTALAGFAPGYRTLLAARATVGIGEASFGTVSPGLIADFFPKERRGQILAWFYVAIPVGSALGYLLGGVLGQNYGWHAAFLMVGVPGLLLAVPMALLRTPPRGGDATHSGGERKSATAGYAALFRNRSFICNTLAMAAMTFSIGGLAQWIPSFLYRVHSLDVAKGNTLFGATTVLAGILGTLAGGWLGDRWQKRSGKGYLLVSGWGFLIGAPFAALAILTPGLTSCMTAIFIAEFFLFLNTGPLNTVIINVTNPAVRAMAFAVNIFFIHALGDAVSPTVLGWLSDQWDLRSALLITPLAMALAGLFCFLCGRFVVQDMAQTEE
jgi:predicted MFS family arabinose efflux permease